MRAEERRPDVTAGRQQDASRPIAVLRRGLVVLTRVMVWTYVTGTLAGIVAVWWGTDRWWLATVFAFGPTWIGLLPLLVLVPIAAMLRARLLPLLLLVGLAYPFVVMGFCVPWPWQQVDAAGWKPVSLITCNIHGANGGWGSMRTLIQRERPDVVALQEVGDAKLQLPDGWHSVRQGQLVLASPFPITNTRKWIRHEPPMRWPPLIALYAVIEIPGQRFHVCNLHLTSPHYGLDAVLDRHTIISPSRSGRLKELIALRAQESKALREWIDTLPQVDVILGDFNMPVNSQIYRRHWADYRNAFGVAGTGLGYTRWANVRNFAFGVRIDHILTNEHWGTVGCQVGPDVGSDHLPVLAEIVRN